MFYLADYSAIFSCPLCDKTADTVVCDGCYLDVLALLNPLYDGLMTYWFEARSMAVIKIKRRWNKDKSGQQLLLVIF